MLKFAIVGCGSTGKRHSGLLSENHKAGVKLIAVVDAKRDRAEAVGSAKNGGQIVINYLVALPFFMAYEY